MNTLDQVEAAHLRSDLPGFGPGDTVRVHVRVVEGGRERVQAYEGVVIARSGGAPDWVVGEAEKRFDFKGRGDGEPTQMMIGVFDSAQTAAAYKWSEEEHDAVVRHLRDTPNPYWFVAEQPKVPAPWPTYDNLVVQGQRTWEKVAAKNLETAADTGIPLESLVAYEKQNRNDDRILAAYDAAISAYLSVQKFAAVLSAPSDGRPRTLEQSFDFGLQRVLDGIEFYLNSASVRSC